MKSKNAIRLFSVNSAMELYPTTTVSVDQAANNIQSAQGALTVIPITIAPSSVTRFTVTQTSTAQDYTLRVWISQTRDGQALGDVWYASRVADKVRAFYTPDQSPPTGLVAIPLMAGNYYINVLNLTLQANSFTFALS
jgi:hypothetical protein